MPYQVTLTRKDGTVRRDLPTFRGRTPQCGDELDLVVNGDIVRARVTGLSLASATSAGAPAEAIDQVKAEET